MNTNKTTMPTSELLPAEDFSARLLSNDESNEMILEFAGRQYQVDSDNAKWVRRVLAGGQATSRDILEALLKDALNAGI